MRSFSLSESSSDDVSLLGVFIPYRLLRGGQLHFDDRDVVVVVVAVLHHDLESVACSNRCHPASRVESPTSGLATDWSKFWEPAH